MNNYLKQHIGYWFDKLRNNVHFSFEAKLSQYDISVASWCILISIYDHQANTVKSLSKYIEVDKASISRVVTKLMNKNLLTHQPGKDNRSGKIELTIEGHNLTAKLLIEAENNEQFFFGHLNAIEKKQLQQIMYKILATTSQCALNGWIKNDNIKEKTMHNIQLILDEAKLSRWPYPKTFELLKRENVINYVIRFTDGYEGIYITNVGNIMEIPPKDYVPLKLYNQFSKEGIKNAIDYHIKNKTSFVEFLADIAKNGSSHYKVDMENRTVTYFNPNEKELHEERVPIWSE